MIYAFNATRLLSAPDLVSAESKYPTSTRDVHDRDNHS
jgi:hypothetical protein